MEIVFKIPISNLWLKLVARNTRNSDSYRKWAERSLTEWQHLRDTLLSQPFCGKQMREDERRFCAGWMQSYNLAGNPSIRRPSLDPATPSKLLYLKQPEQPAK